MADLRDDPELRAEIQAAIDEANQAVSQAEAIKVFRILPRDFSEATGELTPSLKVKRNVVQKEYADEIAAIYRAADARSVDVPASPAPAPAASARRGGAAAHARPGRRARRCSPPGTPASCGGSALLAVAGLPAVLAPDHRAARPARPVRRGGRGRAGRRWPRSPRSGDSTGLRRGRAPRRDPALPGGAAGRGRAAPPYREAGALLGGGRGGLLAVAGALTGARRRAADRPARLPRGSCAQWLVLAGLGAVDRRRAAARSRAGRSRSSPQPYAEATRLLTQLRSVARQLPGATLDPGGIAEHLLEELRAVARRTGRRCSRPAAAAGWWCSPSPAPSGSTGRPALDADSAIADAWASQQPQTSDRSQARSHRRRRGLRAGRAAGRRRAHDRPGGDGGGRGGGLPAVGGRPGDSRLTAPAALRLEAALLFDEVRSLATNEERQRLAREIHDGVAQELVMVGYGIDNALAHALPGRAADSETAEELRALRGEVTRVITELRLSLFELRSEVDRHGGLAAAIAEYARTVGASGRAAGAPVAGRVDRPAARGHRGRTAAHRPGGDHQRAQARRGGESVGHL